MQLRRQHFHEIFTPRVLIALTRVAGVKVINQVALDELEIRAMFNGVASPFDSHRPSLCEAIVRTTGPILELGMGASSTPALHGIAEACGRLVCSYDHDTTWVDRYVGLRIPKHRIEHVASWDECPIESTRWAVALVDHAPGGRRVVDIARLAKHAEVVVVHDTEDATYGYDRIFGAYKYRLDDRDRRPWTTILSNYVDVSCWSIKAGRLVPDGPRQLKTSVLVPCAGQHVARLPELLDALRGQTRRPDEIVVAASGCMLSDLPAIDAEIVHSPTRMSAGANRNRASAAASGDVFIYQDADDLPHPQRVEIIAGLFEAYAIDHLMHFFYYMKDEPLRFSLEQAAARSTYFSALMGDSPYRTGLVESVTNGNIAIARSVAQVVRWPEYFGMGEDQEFNRAVYARTKRTVVTPFPLITYRHNFSTFG